VKSAFGYRFEIGAYMPVTTRVISWGGAIDYGIEDETLQNTRTPEITEFSFKVLAKYQL
jgi:hypothetical protein